jgi:hypothetical protein
MSGFAYVIDQASHEEQDDGWKGASACVETTVDRVPRPTRRHLQGSKFEQVRGRITVHEGLKAGARKENLYVYCTLHIRPYMTTYDEENYYNNHGVKNINKSRI